MTPPLHFSSSARADTFSFTRKGRWNGTCAIDLTHSWVNRTVSMVDRTDLGADFGNSRRPFIAITVPLMTLSFLRRLPVGQRPDDHEPADIRGCLRAYARKSRTSP